MEGSDRQPPAATIPVRVGSSVLGARGHICAFFASRDEEYRVLLPFIREGFQHGDRAFHIVDPERRDDHARRLAFAGIDVAAAIANGQLDLREWSNAHLRGGRFDSEAMLALAGEAVEYARNRGYRATRFVTHMEWALVGTATVEELVEYEARANFSVPIDGDPVICVYDLTKWGGQALVEVMRTHPLIIVGGILQENPFYTPPQEFLLELRRKRDVAADGH